MRCPFCEARTEVLSNDLAFALFDTHPVNEGHLLVVPRRHAASWFDTSRDEREALIALLDEGRGLLDKRFAPDGYNIGINIGEAAGQTIMHLHVHLIPRRRGDCADPRGGVIPARQWYPTEVDAASA